MALADRQNWTVAKTLEISVSEFTAWAAYLNYLKKLEDQN